MEKRPAVLVLVMVVAFIIAIGIAARFGGSGIVSEGDRAPVNKLRAKAGTALENARALVSDIPSTPETRVRPPTSRGGKRRELWNPPDEATARAFVSEEVARAVDAALRAGSVEQGVGFLRSRLAEMKTPEGRSSLYIVLGSLYARAGSLEDMRESYRMAVSTSLSEAERVESVYGYARALLEVGEVGEALEVIEKTRLNDAVVSAGGLQLQMLSGIAQEKLGDLGAAAAVYEAVMVRASEAVDSGQADLDGVYRQAGLRAVRMYLSDGKKKDVARIRRMMKSRVNL